MTFLHNPRFPFTWSFLTLGRGPRDAEYLHNLLDRLCCDPRALDHLMKPNPFEPGKPTALRLVYYRYRFGTWKERRESGSYWLREQVRPPSHSYACSCPPAS